MKAEHSIESIVIWNRTEEDLGERLQPGAAALIALGASDARDKLLERIGPYGGHVLQTSLAGVPA